MVLDARRIDAPHRWDRPVWWEPSTPGARPRVEKVRVIVLHWTGAEHDGIRVSYNLRHRRNGEGRPSPLSIHYTDSTSEMMRFFPEQVGAVYGLCQRLVTRFDIPWRVPTDHEGNLLRRELSDDERNRFRGIIGHYHVHRWKKDPGTHLLRDLMKEACT